MSTPQKQFRPQQPQGPSWLNDYVEVKDRIADFRDKHPEGRIVTEIAYHDAEKGELIFRAQVFRQADDAEPCSTGHARLSRGEDKEYFVEKAETEAIGRALSNLGFAAKRSQDKPRPVAARSASPQSTGSQSGPQEDGTFAIQTARPQALISDKDKKQLCAMWQTAIELGATDEDLREDLSASFDVRHRSDIPAARAGEAPKWMAEVVRKLRERKASRGAKV